MVTLNSCQEMRAWHMIMQTLIKLIQVACPLASSLISSYVQRASELISSIFVMVAMYRTHSSDDIVVWTDKLEIFIKIIDVMIGPVGYALRKRIVARQSPSTVLIVIIVRTYKSINRFV